MTTNVVVLSFAEESRAFQAFSELKQKSADGAFSLVNAIVLSRKPSGELVSRDGWADGSSGDHVLTGTLLGSLIGLFMGPLGMLFGATTGALIGGSVSLDDAAGQSSLLDQMTHAVPAGITAVIATIEEGSPDAVDAIARSLDAVILRCPAEIVAAEVDATAKAQDAAAAAARKVLFEQHKAEWKAKLADWHQQAKVGAEELKSKIKKALQ
ncbi:DUF1269 domain-containing protein [Acetobacter sp.]|jgi:uncharacterized membrane protein|uniref:DUF1269 domain-containing protein n=1 Tax=Acetobacter sp. TaxID=440 RepID=UPI0025C3513E|nr:DUF1269 domain-containing protein [Acetobacter sp.]MCH4089631.1 DUF1269 domain-containing protein [Acetobacter sp.]MCI1300611.1 DUF1269 domain-containing protein [Acetobacter sp.]MCI1317005.1 DUF1269 domain-containing protein [Acetobacter sp.]